MTAQLDFIMRFCSDFMHVGVFSINASQTDDGQPREWSTHGQFLHQLKVKVHMNCNPLSLSLSRLFGGGNTMEPLKGCTVDFK